MSTKMASSSTWRTSLALLVTRFLFSLFFLGIFLSVPIDELHRTFFDNSNPLKRLARRLKSSMSSEERSSIV